MMYIPQTFFSLHTDDDVVDNPRPPLGRFDIPGAVIIESCTALPYYQWFRIRMRFIGHPSPKALRHPE
jgi:hypothetical protein